MDDQHENRGDSQRGGTSGPFEQGGRYYVFLHTVGWEGRLAALLYDFEDVREAVEYVRHRFIPAAMTGAPGAPGPSDVRAQAKMYFPAGSPRLESFVELVDTSTPSSRD